MKKLFLLLLTCALLLGACACKAEVKNTLEDNENVNTAGPDGDREENEDNGDHKDNEDNAENEDDNASEEDSAQAEEHGLVGTWFSVMGGVYGELAFYADGNGKMTVQSETVSFAWTLVDGTVTMDNGAETETLTFDEKTGRLCLNEGNQTFEFYKKTDSPSQENASLEGTWYATIDGAYGEMTFRADGSGSVRAEGLSGAQPFTWSTENDEIVITQENGGSNRMKYRFMGDKLIFEYDGSLQLFSKKTDASQEGEKAHDVSLVGTWGATIEGAYGEMTFRADGSGSVRAEGLSGAQSFTWSTENGRIVITQENGRLDGMDYRVEGDRLIFDYDGETQTFTKK